MFSPWSLEGSPRGGGGEGGGGQGRADPILGLHPWRLALYTALGNGLLALVLVTVLSVWGLLTAFRAPLVWALLSSIALRSPKEALVSGARGALGRLSLAGCAAALLSVPLWPVTAFLRPLGTLLGKPPAAGAGSPELASQIYFRWLWRALVLFEAGGWCWRQWDSALQVASVGLTLGLSGGVLWGVLWASQAYLFQHGDHSGAGARAGAGVGARRGGGRGFFQRLDEEIRRVLAEYLDVSVSVGLIVALLSGVGLLLTVLAVQITNEGSRALSSGYTHASAVAVERGMVTAVKNGTVVAQSLVEENLPKAISWIDEQVDGMLISQNMTHFKPHLDSFFEAVSLYLVTCPNIDRDIRAAEDPPTLAIPRGGGHDPAAFIAVANGTSSSSSHRAGNAGGADGNTGRKESLLRLTATKERCVSLFGLGADQSAPTEERVVTRLQRAWGLMLGLKFREGFSEFLSLATAAAGTLQNIMLAMIPHLGEAAERSSSELLAKTKDSIFSSTSLILQWAANLAATAFSGGLGIVEIGVGIVNFAVNVVIYLTCLFYLLVSEQDPLQALVGTLPLGIETRNKVAAAVGRSVQRVFICTLKMAAFHAGFTWLALRVTMAAGLDVHFPYCTVVAAAGLAAVPILPPYIVAVPVATQLSYIGQGPLGLCFFATFYTVCSFADEAILSEIERVNPYLAFLSIFGGLYFFDGVQGAVLGPLLLAFLSCIHSLYMDAVSERKKSVDLPPSTPRPAAAAPSARAEGVETRGQRRRRKPRAIE